MARELPERWQVILVLFAVTIVAYVSAGSFPDPHAYGPLLSIFILFFIYPVAYDGGWLMFVALFFPIYLAIVSLLSIALLAKSQRAWTASALLFLVLLLATTWYFISAWELGNKWQGSTYVWLVLGLNVLVASITASLVYLSKRKPGRPRLLLGAHAASLFWLSWIAFPYLGELI